MTTAKCERSLVLKGMGFAIRAKKLDETQHRSEWFVSIMRNHRIMKVPFSKGGQDSPTLADVLYCIVSDSQSVIACPEFEEWADSLGYSEDSREAERIFNACRQQYRAFKGLLKNPREFDKLVELFQDF